MNITYIPDPETTPWDLWSAELCFQEPALPVKIAEKNWHLFASELQNIFVLNNLVTPDYRNFPDWQAWGSRLKQTSPTLN
jgi:hypothetical protein